MADSLSRDRVGLRGWEAYDAMGGQAGARRRAKNGVLFSIELPTWDRVEAAVNEYDAAEQARTFAVSSRRIDEVLSRSSNKEKQAR